MIETLVRIMLWMWKEGSK